MLVLTRRQGESIDIGGCVSMVVQKVAGNRVMLAFEAPRDVPIRRSELKPYAATGRTRALTIQRSR